MLPKVIDIGRILKTKSNIIILRIGQDINNESRVDIVDKLNSTGMKRRIKWLDGKFTPAELKEIEDNSMCMIISPLPFLYFKGGFILFDNYTSDQLADIIMEETGHCNVAHTIPPDIYTQLHLFNEDDIHEYEDI